jgi:hypothetical protein
LFTLVPLRAAALIAAAWTWGAMRSMTFPLAGFSAGEPSCLDAAR